MQSLPASGGQEELQSTGLKKKGYIKAPLTAAIIITTKPTAQSMHYPEEDVPLFHHSRLPSTLANPVLLD